MSTTLYPTIRQLPGIIEHWSRKDPFNVASSLIYVRKGVKTTKIPNERVGGDKT